MSRNCQARRNHFHRTAFSLIEVLVVVCIISLLISVMLPFLCRARQLARNLTCASHLRGFGNALTFYKTGAGRYPIVQDSETTPRVGSLANIRGVARLLVRQSLGDPRSLYCPVSLDNDPQAVPPENNETGDYYWKTGKISYTYLSGVTSYFSDSFGNPTFNPDLESPDGPRHVRAVLAGDRTGRFTKNKNMIGSNHGEQGGWFYFVGGELTWRDMRTLAPHPTSTYIWYWPRTAPPPPKVVAGS